MSEQGPLNRDWLADIIGAYMGEGGEFRTYDLADRILRKIDTDRACHACGQAMSTGVQGRFHTASGKKSCS